MRATSEEAVTQSDKRSLLAASSSPLSSPVLSAAVQFFILFFDRTRAVRPCVGRSECAVCIGRINKCIFSIFSEREGGEERDK